MQIQVFTVEDPRKKIILKTQGNVQEDSLEGLSGNGDVIVRILQNKPIHRGSIFIKKSDSSFERKFLSNGEILLRDVSGKLEFYLEINGSEVKFNGTELFSVEVASFEEWLKRLFSPKSA